MPEQLKIKISIADRIYPLTIHPDQEEGLRIAAKKIEAMIKQYEQNYAVRDKQDVLAMSALRFAAQTEQTVLENDKDKEKVYHKLMALDHLLDHHLS
ncbi:cell division protein ZapA [Aquimarina sp. ERC-38]|uniref:cell division protein ZapA n=1 Tax=Aquimarina sp. ERC-38 TaxID=2949996 RepID=UPI002247C146|nr:cell division protein ZapA [Aquimarina sp. ERC-38]UZO79543.1 cell division protein ZapA [Aquimarina sp. ERC-38]